MSFDDAIKKMFDAMEVPDEVFNNIWDVAYKQGVKEGITMYAWWKDGKQEVGTTGKSLRTALDEVDNELIGTTNKTMKQIRDELTRG